MTVIFCLATCTFTRRPTHTPYYM